MTEKYDIILADPPWHYNNRKTGGERKNKTKFGGGAMKHYPLMKDAELTAMGDTIKAITADNAHLFMWATMPRLDFATQLVKDWGFQYSTAWMIWIKTLKNTGFIFTDIGNGLKYGPGAYKASNAEIVLMGRKGRALKQTHRMTPSIFFAPLQERHSQKPANVHEEIDRLYPEYRKIEIFARRPFPGWHVWGNEVESVDLREAGASCG